MKRRRKSTATRLNDAFQFAETAVESNEGLLAYLVARHAMVTNRAFDELLAERMALGIRIDQVRFAHFLFDHCSNSPAALFYAMHIFSEHRCWGLIFDRTTPLLNQPELKIAESTMRVYRLFAGVFHEYYKEGGRIELHWLMKKPENESRSDFSLLKKLLRRHLRFIGDLNRFVEIAPEGLLQGEWGPIVEALRTLILTDSCALERPDSRLPENRAPRF